MNRFAIRIMLVLTIGGLVGLSCDKPSTPNRAPTITSLVLPDSVDAGNDETLNCIATDPDSTALAYNWTCSSGLLQSMTGSTVVWTAPDSSGAATISVTVLDDSGASDTDSGTVTVNPVTTTIIDWDGAVAASDIALWTVRIPMGYTVHGSFAVDGQDITFLMLDSSNYQSWRFDSSYTAMVEIENSAGADFSAMVSANGTYHFILDNTDNADADSSAHLFVQQTSP
jgi:hypothetical protein